MSTTDTGAVGGVDWGALTGYTETTGESSEGNLLDAEVFMELLITQLENQDPLSPMENQDFTAQLAQLTEVEQLRAANTNLETLQLYEASINNAQSVSLIGKQIKALGDQFKFSGDSVSLSFHSAGEGTAKINIFGPEGDVVRTLEKSGIEEGMNSVSWDGYDINNSPCKDGDYTFSVSVENERGESVSTYTMISGTVTSVVFENGVPNLDVGGQRVTIGDIYEVNTE